MKKLEKSIFVLQKKSVSRLQELFHRIVLIYSYFSGKTLICIFWHVAWNVSLLLAGLDVISVSRLPYGGLAYQGSLLPMEQDIKSLFYSAMCCLPVSRPL